MWTVITTDFLMNGLMLNLTIRKKKVLAGLVALQTGGPTIGRPLVDTVNASKYNNMKELRVQHRGDPIRAFFAFDPLRQAIVLCAGNKGGNEKRFYKQMILLLILSLLNILKNWRNNYG